MRTMMRTMWIHALRGLQPTSSLDYEWIILLICEPLEKSITVKLFKLFLIKTPINLKPNVNFNKNQIKETNTNNKRLKKRIIVIFVLNVIVIRHFQMHFRKMKWFIIYWIKFRLAFFLQTQRFFYWIYFSLNKINLYFFTSF